MKVQALTAAAVLCWRVPSADVARAAQTDGADAILEARIGAVDGPMALGRIEALEADASGRIYVLESDAARVRVFDRDGTPVLTIGRRGSGPGEFLAPVGLAWSQGSLWVVDPGNARASLFDRNGRPLGERRLASGFTLAPWPGRFDRHGNLYHYASPPATETFAYVMVKYDREMQPVDTLVPPVSAAPDAFFETRTRRYGTVRAAVPFTPRTIWRLGVDGRFRWAWTARYEVFVGEGRGRVAGRPAQRLPVTGAERDDALAGLARFVDVGGRVDVARIPRVKPALRDFVLDDADRIWVMPELTDAGTGRVLDLFEADGRFVRRIALPVRVSHSPPIVIRGGRIYAVERDELDVQYVVALRIANPGDRE